MTKTEKFALARDLNTEVAATLGETPRHVSFNFDWKASSTHGRCKRNGGLYTVEISSSLLHDQDIRETLLHELCHVYAPKGAHHGPAWRSVAAKVGKQFNINITRTNNREHDRAGLMAEITCPFCGCVTPLYKKSGAYYHIHTYRCRMCGEASQGMLQIRKYK